MRRINKKGMEGVKLFYSVIGGLLVLGIMIYFVIQLKNTGSNGIKQNDYTTCEKAQGIGINFTCMESSFACTNAGGTSKGFDKSCNKTYKEKKSYCCQLGFIG